MYNKLFLMWYPPMRRHLFDHLLWSLLLRNILIILQHSAINKFNNYRDVNTSLATNMLEDSLESLIFQMQHMIRNTTIGFNLKIAICFNFLQEDVSQKCVIFLDAVMHKLKSNFNILDNIRYTFLPFNLGR